MMGYMKPSVPISSGSFYEKHSRACRDKKRLASKRLITILLVGTGLSLPEAVKGVIKYR